jgi:hypothetical protein
MGGGKPLQLAGRQRVDPYEREQMLIAHAVSVLLGIVGSQS